MRPELQFDFKQPDYRPIMLARVQRLARIRENPDMLPGLFAYYRENPWDFIQDWGVTVEPRNAELGKPVNVPFILFPKQREWLEWAYNRWQGRESGLTEKSRDAGVSWLSVALACTLCLFRDNINIGFGSRKEEYVDKAGFPKALFWKAREFMDHLPKEFTGGWTRADSTHMRIGFPSTKSVITGEAGDGIGRGDRTTLYFVDEAQPLTASVLTPSGWRAMGDLVVGDEVIHPSGNAIKVLGVRERVTVPIYEFGFSDGTTAQSSPNHLWKVASVIGPIRQMVKRSHEIAEDAIYRSPGGQTQFRYRLPVNEPVEFSPVEELPLHPYFLGVLLGDGCLTKPSIEFASDDPEIVRWMSEFAPPNFGITYAGKITYRVVHPKGRGRGTRGNSGYLKEVIEALGLLGKYSWEKSIPEWYKLSSRQDRLEMLRGLMDTDGSASGGKVTFHSSSKQLSDDVAFIVRSLGGMATQKIKPDHRGHRDQHYVYIRMPDGVIPFRLKRKADKVRQDFKQPFPKTITSVRLLPEQEVQCIQVDAEDGLYITDGFAVTHNSAFLMRPALADAGLIATTNCRIDISTPNGLGNPFHVKRMTLPPHRVFTFTWRDDMRRDEAWYEKMKQETDPVTFAQEFDLNYSASVEGVLIPSEWVQAAINADQKLGFTVTGQRRAALDVADEGKDKNALCIGHGIAVESVPEWSGKGSDILGTVQRAFALCDEADVTDMRFDSDGLGAGVRGDARLLNESREHKIRVTPWRGSGKVAYPDKAIPSANPTGRKDRTNQDFFSNAKAQGWWELRVRFQRTYRAVTEEGYEYDPDDLIVLREGLGGLYSELSQPTYTVNTAGKIIVDKQPDGTPSPNKADSVMMLFAPKQSGGYDLAAAL